MADKVLPACFTVLKETEEWIEGFVKNTEDLQTVLEAFEKCYMVSFVSWAQRKGHPQGGDTKRLLWIDAFHKEFSVPCIVENRFIRRCSYGGQPRKRKQTHAEENESDPPRKRRNRQCMQSSQKIGCDAKIFIKTYLVFEDYKMPKSASRRHKFSVIMSLKDDMKLGKVPCSRRVFVSLPKAIVHTNHLVCVRSGSTMGIHDEVRNKIHDLASQGHTSVPVIRKMLQNYVVNDLCAKCSFKPLSRDQAYFPNSSVIRRHIHVALAAGQYSLVDQDNLEQMINKMKEERPEVDSFFLRKCSSGSVSASSRKQCPRQLRVFQPLPGESEDEDDGEDEQEGSTFLFVHQDRQQKQLLQKYGKVALLDATYKTTKYTLPLYLLVVRTNSSYFPVAEFIVERETRACIHDALKIVKEWNPEWEPSVFMLDYCDEEYQALQAVFPSAKKCVGTFHQEQAWHRWLKNKRNCVSDKAGRDLLLLLRTIAGSRSAEQFAAAVASLKACEIYENNRKLQKYLDRYWLGIPERWCAFHTGPGFEGLIVPDNDVQSLNSSLKNCLGTAGNDTLSNLVHALIKIFLPRQWISYVRLNYNASSRPYDPCIPEYLGNRPTQVVEECFRSLMAASYCRLQQIQKGGRGVFLVQSETKQATHCVSLGSEGQFPSCSCLDFQAHLLPCKHMFAVFQNKVATWNDLPADYINSPYLTLDADVLSREVLEACDCESQAELPEHQECGILQEADEEDLCSGAAAAVGSDAAQLFREQIQKLNELSFLCPDSDLLLAQTAVLQGVSEALRHAVSSQSGPLLPQAATAVRPASCPLQLLKRKKRKQSAKDFTQSKRRCGDQETDVPGLAMEMLSEPCGTEPPAASFTVTATCSPDRQHGRSRDLQQAAGSPCTEGDCVRFQNPAGCRRSSTIVSQIVTISDPLLKCMEGLQEDLNETIEYEMSNTTLQIGPLSVSTSSLNTLIHPQCLDDQVIEAFLSLLRNKQNASSRNPVLVIPPSTTSCWNCGCHKAVLYTSVDLSAFRWVFAPICFELSHWVLIVVDVVSSEVSVLDSLTSHSLNPDETWAGTCWKHWQLFYEERGKAVNQQPVVWQSGRLVSALQTHSSSSGVFLLMNAMAILSGVELSRITQDQVPQFRGLVLHKLTHSASPPPTHQIHCDMPGCLERSQEKSACIVCGRWCHHSHFTGFPHVSGRREEFLCMGCKSRYGVW